jgi:hypothetical protein
METQNLPFLRRDLWSNELVTVLPMVIHHFAPNGQATPTSSMGSMAGKLLNKIA